MALSENYVNGLIRNFENAVRDHETMGACHPEDWQEIQERYQRERRRIKEYLLTAQPKR